MFTANNIMQHISHYEKLPMGWAVATISQVFVINPKIQAQENTEAGFVPMTNICDGFDNRFTYEVRKWEEIKNGFSRFADGDIAVAKISPCLENSRLFMYRQPVYKWYWSRNY